MKGGRGGGKQGKEKARMGTVWCLGRIFYIIQDCIRTHIPYLLCFCGKKKTCCSHKCGREFVKAFANELVIGKKRSHEIRNEKAVNN